MQEGFCGHDQLIADGFVISGLFNRLSGHVQHINKALCFIEAICLLEELSTSLFETSHVVGQIVVNDRLFLVFQSEYDILHECLS